MSLDDGWCRVCCAYIMELEEDICEECAEKEKREANALPVTPPTLKEIKAELQHRYSCLYDADPSKFLDYVAERFFALEVMP